MKAVIFFYVGYLQVAEEIRATTSQSGWGGIIMQVETDFNGLRNGPYGSWLCHPDSNQMSLEADTLPEKIYSMVSKLVDEDSEVDIAQATLTSTKTIGATGFYDGTHAWSDVPLSNSNSLAYRTSSPAFNHSAQMLCAGLEQLDLSQNVLDLSFLTSIDDLDRSGGKIGENLDSGFASPADKMGCLTGSALLCDDDLSGLSNWDWGLSKPFDTDSSQNYMNLLAQNPDLLDQIVHGDASIDGILTNGLSQLDLLQSNCVRQSPYIMPQTGTPDNHLQMNYLLNPTLHQSAPMTANLQTMDNVNMRPSGFPNGDLNDSRYNGLRLKPAVDNIEAINALVEDEACDSGPSNMHAPSNNPLDAPTSLLETFSPFRPPPELPFNSVNGPLGYNNNNEYRPYVPQPPRNGFNVHLPGKEPHSRIGNGVIEHDGRNLHREKQCKPIHNFGNGLGGTVNGGIQQPRLNAVGPFRWPPPFLPARLPMYPPPMDPAELYPLPWTHRPLFPLPAPMYNVRQMRRNPVRDELSARLDQCYEQFRLLEKERKKTEAELARHNPGKKLSSANSMTVPRLPPSPTRVDRLVVDQLREHARVVTLVGKMERLRNKSFPGDVHSCLSGWDNAIRKVQALRQDEVRCRSRILLQPSDHRPHQEDKGIGALAGGIHELSVASRHARTTLWACLMITLNANANVPASPSLAATPANPPAAPRAPTA